MSATAKKNQTTATYISGDEAASVSVSDRRVLLAAIPKPSPPASPATTQRLVVPRTVLMIGTFALLAVAMAAAGMYSVASECGYNVYGQTRAAIIGFRAGPALLIPPSLGITSAPDDGGIGYEHLLRGQGTTETMAPGQ